MMVDILAMAVEYNVGTENSFLILIVIELCIVTIVIVIVIVELVPEMYEAPYLIWS